ncbi:MAG: protein kinase, partial [Planctomycetota bacterium]|nr:protein kinase [Planctomycetota bacterium]
ARLKDKNNPPMSTADFVTTFTRRPDPTEPGVPGAVPQTPVPAKVGETTVQPPVPAQSFGKAWEKLRHAPYEQTVLKLVSDLALGLAYAHEHEILHLDIKPGNILMAEDGRPMLLDFHLSTLGDAAAGQAEVEGGTLPYMSPEHLGALVGKGHVDRRSDIYSLGIVLFELLTGRLPFPSKKGKRTRPDRDQDTRVKVSKLTAARNTVPSPRKLRPTLSPGAEAIILRCLAPNPDKRYATAHELLEDLDCQLHDRPLKYAENTSWKERFTKWRKRHPTLSSTSVVTAISLVLLGALGAGVKVTVDQKREAQALQAKQLFRLDAPQMKAGLMLAAQPTPEMDRSVCLKRQQEVVQRLDVFGAATSDDWRDNELVRRLPEADREVMEQEIGQLLCLLGKARERLSDFDTSADKDQSNLEQALVWIRRGAAALKGHSGSATANRLHAGLLRRLNRIDEAEAIEGIQADSQVSQEASESSWTTVEAVLAADYSGAADMLKELTQNTPKDMMTWFTAGTCHLGLGHLSEAETCFTVCITMQPRSVEAWSQRSISRIKQEDWKGALDDIDRILELDPTISAVWYNRMLALRGLKRWDEALVALDRADLAGFPETRVRFMRAELLGRLGDLEKSALEFRKGLESRPVDAMSYAVRGDKWAGLDPQAALADFREALKLDPRCFDAARNAAYVLDVKMKDPRAAVVVLDDMLQKTSRDPLAWSGRAVLHARLGDVEQARTDIAVALRLAPERGWVQYHAACVEMLIPDGNTEVALAMLAKAFAKEPKAIEAATDDPDLGTLVETAGFKAILAAAQTLSAAQEK